MMTNLLEYEVSVDEIHHTEKRDAPSGTAITLAEGILKHSAVKKKWINEDASSDDELPIKSFRIDQIPGTHTVKYNSLIDDVEIRHIAHSREGFALGAVRVAEWIRDKKGVLSMDDYLKF
jgi:4-hydroxy-tetrahydrodipicolinate reductase